MENKKCNSCEYYRQHYILDHRKLFRIFCGHCILFPTKRKRPDSAACDQFIPAPPDECAFVTKEYLSKALLQYVLNLEMLPEIEDMPK